MVGKIWGRIIFLTLAYLALLLAPALGEEQAAGQPAAEATEVTAEEAPPTTQAAPA